MKKYKEDKNLELTKITEEILEFWKKENIFQKSIENRKNSPEFIFFDGPPSVNGSPGIHHIMARTIKDIFCRYQTLKGKKVYRKPGWDTHGLPIEIAVEKELGINKEDIGNKISIYNYNKECKRSVIYYIKIWKDLTEKIGYWIDLNNSYNTYDSKYIESVWWILKQIYNQKKIYKGYTVQPYSPKAGTALSSHELNQPGMYRDVLDLSITVQFEIEKNFDKHIVWKDILIKSKYLDYESIDCYKYKINNSIKIYFLAWTTTPWTLSSNTALAINSLIEYVLVKTFNQYSYSLIYIILAKKLINEQLNENYFESYNDKDYINLSKNQKIPYQIIKIYKGEELIGIKYKQLLNWGKPIHKIDNAFQIIHADFVNIESGTGIVHIAPTFGVDDANIAKKNKIPAILVLNEKNIISPLVDMKGKFLNIIDIPLKFRGKFVKNEFYDKNLTPKKSVDEEILILLKNKDKVFKIKKYLHSYPYCWRTDKPILYYPVDSWFIKVTEIKNKLIKFNQNINWKPKHTGIKQFNNWLENINDWNLSRSRFWGTPLPIWRTKNNSEEICIGSMKELIEEIEKSIKHKILLKNPFKDFIVNDFSDENYNKIDLHKHVLDSIILVSNNGEPMYRELDVIDVWFDSGAMPYGQNHYPFSSKKQPLSANFIAEGIDQTRGWFYTLHVISVLLFNQVAYKNVISNGLVLDKKGQKMSKRLNNTINPFVLLKKYGPDAIRWYMISNTHPWENIKFNIKGIEEVKKKFFRTLHSIYSFFVLYANVDNFLYLEKEIPFIERSELDKWIISKLNLLIKEVDKNYSNYESTPVSRLITSFICDDLSNWYIRLNRRRFWKKEYSKDKISAYQTLYQCLESVIIISSSIVPFYTDYLFKNLNKITNKKPFISVHLTNFPLYNQEEIDDFLVQSNKIAQTLVSSILSLRKKANIKVRQPLSEVLISIPFFLSDKYLNSIFNIIKHETNIQNIKLISQQKINKFFIKSVKPNFKILGPKFKKSINNILKNILSLNNDNITELEKNKKIYIKNHEILLSEVEIYTKDIDGWIVDYNKKFTIALNISLNDGLIEQGVSREFINRVQNLRKKMDLYLTDKINIKISNNNILYKALINNEKYIKEETLASNIIIENNINSNIEIEINKSKIKLIIEKL